LLGMYLVPYPISVVPGSRTGRYVTRGKNGRVVRWLCGGLPGNGGRQKLTWTDLTVVVLSGTMDRY